jgi:hypothetical protein
MTPEELAKIEARYPDADPIDNDVRALVAEVRRLELQVEHYRVALEQISTLAIELSDCDPEGCPAGSLQRTAQRALMEKQHDAIPAYNCNCLSYSRGFHHEGCPERKEKSEPQEMRVYKQIERCQKCGVAHEPKEQPFCSE